MTIPQHDDYTVRIDAFQGPLDLLMYLIRRAEVDITDIPVADINAQYLKFLKQIDLIDIDAAGEFLVMAATLMEIKSRMITPPLPSIDGNEGKENDQENAIDPEVGLNQADPRYELVKQLLAYKKFRDAAGALDQRREDWEDRFPLTAARVGQPKKTVEESDLPRPGDEDFDPDDLDTNPQADQNAQDLEDISVWDLAQMFQRIISAIDFGRMGDHQIEYDDTPIELHEEDLLDQLKNAHDQRVSLRRAFTGRSRVEAIGLFLATLELVRQHRVRVLQDRIHDDIVLVPKAEGDTSFFDEDDADDVGAIEGVTEEVVIVDQESRTPQEETL